MQRASLMHDRVSSRIVVPKAHARQVKYHYVWYVIKFLFEIPVLKLFLVNTAIEIATTDEI